MKRILFVTATSLSFILLLLACTAANSSHPDISNLEDNECKIQANDIFSSVKAIELETTDSCLLSSPSLVDFCDDGILVWNKDIVYRFDHNGYFKNRIGKIGHGFGEYTGVNSINYDKKRKIVYIGTFSNDVYKYSIDGKYIGKIKVSGGKDILMTSKWSEPLGLYICETRNYRHDGLDVALTTWTTDGKKNASYHIYSDNENVDHNFTRTGSLTDTGDGILFRLPFCDTVYCLSKDGVSEYTIVNRGKHTPSRNMVEDNSNEAKLERISGKATFGPWISNGNKVADLVDNDNKAKNPTLIIATEKASFK